MKKSTLFITICILTTSNLFAQIDWVPYAGNPVIDENFDTSAHGCYAPSVFFDGTTYHMCYTRELVEDELDKIGYATSPDGANWTLIDSLALEPSSDPTRFDSGGVEWGWIIKDGDTLKIWYHGGGQDIRGIGYAWSIDGHNWTKVDGSGNGRCVYDETMDGPNTVALGAPCVVKDGGTYHIWYFKANYIEPNIFYNIGYATSPNGLDWTNIPGPGTNGAVLSLGGSGKFDESGVIFPSVIKENNEFKMWYTGSDNLDSWRIGYATSSDGINWTKVDGNGTNGACLDDGAVASVNKIGDTYHMWYSSEFGMCYATSIGTGVEDFNRGKISTSFALAQNYPNPFNPTTRILYVLPSSEFVSLKVYDIIGREIQTLVSEVQIAGTYSINFNANDLTGGIYFYRLKIGDKFTETKKMILIK